MTRFRSLAGAFALSVLFIGGCDDECFSPSQNASHAYDDGAQGCACDVKRDQPACVSGSALECSREHWVAVEDGQCFPGFRSDAGPLEDASFDAAAEICFSPTQNTSHAYDPGARGCDCTPGKDKSVCVSGAALICQIHRWVAVEDGPCEPMSFDDAGHDDAGDEDSGS
jgi:hypothetical protein